MSLTLNAPTPYPPLAASSRSCRMDTNGIAILLNQNFPGNLAAVRAIGLPSGGNCNRPYGSRAAQAESVLRRTAGKHTGNLGKSVIPTNQRTSGEAAGSLQPR